MLAAPHDQETKGSPDRPTVEDRLGFDLYVRGIVRTIRDAIQRGQLPLTIGIYGRWGSGKTSLMRMVERELVRQSEPSVAVQQERAAASRMVPYVWLALAVVAVAVMECLFGGPQWAGPLLAPLHFSPSQAVFAVRLVAFALLGGLIRAVHRTWWHQRVERDFAPLDIYWAVAIPVQASIAAIIALALVAGGLRGLDRLSASVPAVLMSYVAFWIIGAINYLGALEQFLRRRSWIADHGDAAGGPDREAQSSAHPQTIWFNAWRYAREKELWATLLQRILSELEINARGSQRLRIKWRLWLRSVQWKSGFFEVALKLAPTLGKALLLLILAGAAAWVARLPLSGGTGGAQNAASAAAAMVSAATAVAIWLRSNVGTPLADIDLAKYQKAASYKAHLGFLTEFSQELKRVTTIARGVGNPVVIMLDDLDRCLPEQAVSVLEAIKLFVTDDAPVVFVVGADREFIERAIDVKYAALKKQEDLPEGLKERFSQLGHEYLEKIIQLPFNLPPIEVDRIDRFIDERFADDALVKDHSHIFAAGLLPNPRQVLRAVSIFKFVAGLADENGALYAGEIRPDILAKLIVIQYRWPDLYAEVVERPGLLGQIERAHADPPSPNAGVETPFAKYLARGGLIQLLTVPNAAAIANTNLRPYLFITARAQAQAGGIVRGSLDNAPRAEAPAENELEAYSQGAPTYATPPEQPAPAAPVAAPPVAAAPTSTAPVPPPSFPESEFNEFVKWIDELHSRGADPAVLTRLVQGRERIQALLASNSVAEASALLNDGRGLALSTQASLSEKSSARLSSIEVTRSKDGQLVFRRAISYAAVDVMVELTGSPRGELHVSASVNHQMVFEADLPRPSRDLSRAIEQFQRGTMSAEDAVEMGHELGKRYLPIPEDALVKLGAHRVRIVSPSRGEFLPWELFRFRVPFPIGLDPVRSVVRSAASHSELSTARAPLPFRINLVGFSDDTLSEDDLARRLKEVQGALGPLREAQRFELTTAVNPRLDDLLQAAKTGPPIFHIIAGNGAGNESGIGTHGQATSKGTKRDTWLSAKGLGEVLSTGPTRVVLLEMGQSADMARLLSKDVPFVVGMQSASQGAAFSIPFYAALLRTGQADFALTSARRALALTLPKGMDDPQACSPILFVPEGSDCVVFSS